MQFDEVKVDQVLRLTKSVYEEANDHSPGGYLGRKDDKVIVRRISDNVKFEYRFFVSHEDVTDGRSFGVTPDEIEPWVENIKENKV